jgi:hypothetical protein
MDAISGGAAGGKLAVEAVKFGVRRGWFRRLTDAFRKKHRVFVLGSTGAGKTNFLLSLRKESPTAISHLDRTEFVMSHTLDIGGNLFAFVDTSGQPGQESRRSQAIRSMPRLKTTGVINVVSYGYHEYRRGSAGIVGAGGSIDGAFLAERREVEIAALSEWLPVLGSIHTIDWMITLVTKADLWWDRRDEVLEHYTSGAYGRALESVRELSPSAIEYCSVIHKFYGESVLPGIFDEGNKAQLRDRMLRALIAAVGQGDHRE